MSRSDWRQRITPIVAGVLLIGVVLDFCASQYLNTKNVIEAYRKDQRNSEQEAEKASQHISDECSVSIYSLDILRECLSKELNTYIGQDNKTKDAEAQQEMAQWAFATFVVGALGLVVSIFGLAALWASLRQTRQAITNEREIGNAQVRAYLNIEFEDINTVAGGNYPFKIINTGQSPAISVRYVGGQMVLDHPLSVTQGDLITVNPDDTGSKNVIPAGKFITGEAKFDKKPSQSELSIIKANGPKRIYLVIRVFYKDFFKEEHETKLCVFSVASPVAPLGLAPTRFEWALADVLNDAT